MIRATLYNTTAKKVKTVVLPKALFEAKLPPKLLAQAIRVYQFNSHQRTSKVKSRGEVARTKAKLYRQKGTGRARHGSKNAPLFVGGGVSHGPTGEKPKALRLTTRLRRQGLIAALTAKASKTNLITGLDKLKPKTKPLDQLLATLTKRQKTLLLASREYASLKKAGHNLPYLMILPLKTANALKVLEAEHLLLDADALETLATWLTPKKSAPKPKKLATRN